MLQGVAAGKDGEVSYHLGQFAGCDGLKAGWWESGKACRASERGGSFGWRAGARL